MKLEKKDLLTIKVNKKNVDIFKMYLDEIEARLSESTDTQDKKDLNQMKRNGEKILKILNQKSYDYDNKSLIGATYPNLGIYKDIIQARAQISSNAKILEPDLSEKPLSPKDLDFIEAISCSPAFLRGECPHYDSKVEVNGKNSKIEILYKTMFSTEVYIQIIGVAIRAGKETIDLDVNLHSDLEPLSISGKKCRENCKKEKHTTMMGDKNHPKGKNNCAFKHDENVLTLFENKNEAVEEKMREKLSKVFPIMDKYVKMLFPDTYDKMSYLKDHPRMKCRKIRINTKNFNENSIFSSVAYVDKHTDAHK